MELQVVEVRVRDGRASVIVADQVHDVPQTTMLRLEFPFEEHQSETHLSTESSIVAAAQAVLVAAAKVLSER